MGSGRSHTLPRVTCSGTVQVIIIPEQHGEVQEGEMCQKSVHKIEYFYLQLQITFYFQSLSFFRLKMSKK